MAETSYFGIRKFVSDSLSPILLLSLSAFVGCDWTGKPKEEDRPVPAERVMEFAPLYATHCAGCHGPDGKNGPAPPHNDAIFLAIVPDEVLHRVVAEGRNGTPMPAFAKDKGGALTEAQIEVLAKGIRSSWQPANRLPDTQGSGLPSYWLADAKSGDKDAGRKAFARSCAECHGKDGKGTKEAGAVNDRAFLALASDQMLRRIIITGRPDFGMPNALKRDHPPLTSQEINDLVALLAYWRLGGDTNGK